ncbi:V-type proton ATPase subunit E [Nosema granulosis]|uniref:V-type proton ATPase subunit E n=1 Tax=Nosema granulosis TaxID=83296 RepID=A0A9P6L034_9MICR|nr:V-type proton ATPase subunit E [Nosema granulosis]
MEKLPNKDIERMITFINHEVEEKIKEIEIKGIQEYNSEKAKLIKEQTNKIEDEFISKQQEIECKKFRIESNIISKYRQMYIEKKNEILRSIFKKVEEKVKQENLTQKFIKSTLSKVKLSEKEYYAYCKSQDKKLLKNVVSVEVKEMDEKALGGIIIVSKDGKTIIDNSYLTRIEVIKDLYVSDINNILFNKVPLE